MGCKPMEKPKQKPKHKKGLWSPEEDQRLKNYVIQHGHGCWSSVPINAGLQRNGKSCRLRWINYLRPGLKRGMFTVQEEETVLALHRLLGNKWSQIAQHLPGRTDNEIKNYWHSYLKKRIVKAEANDQTPTKTQDFNSNPDNKHDFSPSPQKPTTQISSFESFEHMEVSSTDTDQSVPAAFNFPKETHRSSLPKILFAEWLSLDHVHGQNFANSGEPVVSKDVFGHNSNFPDDFVHGLLSNEEIFGSEFHDHGLSNGSADDMFSSQFKLEGQIPGSEFADFLSGDEICSSFNMNSDVMYL